MTCLAWPCWLSWLATGAPRSAVSWQMWPTVQSSAGNNWKYHSLGSQWSSGYISHPSSISMVSSNKSWKRSLQLALLKAYDLPSVLRSFLVTQLQLMWCKKWHAEWIICLRFLTFWDFLGTSQSPTEEKQPPAEAKAKILVHLWTPLPTPLGNPSLTLRLYGIGTLIRSWTYCTYWTCKQSPSDSCYKSALFSL